MERFFYQLQRFDPGIIFLDNDYELTGINNVACDVLGVKPKQVVGRNVFSIHPNKSQNKIQWLLESTAAAGPGQPSPPPMTMMINIPDRVLITEVTRLEGYPEAIGYSLIFYDVTEETTHPIEEHIADQQANKSQRLLFKVPVYSNNRVMLIELDHVTHLQSKGHYTNIYTNASDNCYLCTLSLSDLENRLDPQQFIRIHRSHMVNMHYANSFEKQGTTYYLKIKTNQKEETIPISRAKAKYVKEVIGLN
ncbi:MAG: LytTR family transcriptional regulator DNA-binding domain-containing protein [Pseudomonadales bacterium]